MTELSDGLYDSRLTSLPLLHQGKVRDLYEVDANRLLIVATDRISAFDVVLPDPIPGKGSVLTALSRFWFYYTRPIVPNHLLDEGLQGILTDSEECQRVATRAMLVKRVRPLPIEAIARGYLIGSGWQEYQATGRVCGIALPSGLRLADRLPEPIFTPSTKAVEGEHDENVRFEDVIARIGEELATKIREITLHLYIQAAEYALQRGIIIADTKFEFGLDANGELILIDEALTPDSSRFWPADQYSPGSSPPSFDKQFVRDYLEGLDWDHSPPGPRLPAEVVAKTAEKYRQAQRQLVTEVPE